MKKYLLIAVSAVLLVALSVGTTVAFLTDRDETVNVFTVGSVEIELVEDYVQNSKLVPGKDINKDIQIENKGNIYYGFSANTDIVTASVEAYVNAISKII